MLLLIGIILGAAVVVFALQNVALITVSFLAWDFNGSVALIVLLALALGIIISILFSLPSIIKTSWEQSQLKRNNDKLQKDLEDHKMKLAEAEKKVVEPVVIITNDMTTDAF